MAQLESAGPAAVVGIIPSASRANPIPDDAKSVWIGDERFMQELKRLKDLRSFLLREAVPCKAELDFGELNLLQKARQDEEGRPATVEEWRHVEERTQALLRLLSEPLRRKFILSEIPQWVGVLPIAFGTTAVLSLLSAFFWFHLEPVNMKMIVPCYLVWLMSLGALGAVASIGMNALSVQDDITFDPTNKRLTMLRISLGALFGLVLALPFGFADFVTFCHGLVNVNGNVTARLPDAGVPAGQIARQALMLLLPFVLGFSTSLVILILNRLVDAVQSFFGKAGRGEERPTGSQQTRG